MVCTTFFTICRSVRTLKIISSNRHAFRCFSRPIYSDMSTRDNFIYSSALLDTSRSRKRPLSPATLRTTRSRNLICAMARECVHNEREATHHDSMSFKANTFSRPFRHIPVVIAFLLVPNNATPSTTARVLAPSRLNQPRHIKKKIKTMNNKCKRNYTLLNSSAFNKEQKFC